MTIFRGINVVEALALYNNIKVYFDDPKTKQSRLLDFGEAMTLAMSMPNNVWAELDESEIKRQEDDPSGKVCDKCGMAYFQPLTDEDIERIQEVRNKFLDYLDGNKNALDDDAILFAEMLMGTFETFHTHH